MSRPRRDQREFEHGINVPPETEYLIKDVEELVNKNFGEFLGDAPFKIKAADLRPELLTGEIPSGIDTLAFRSLDFAKSSVREFSGIDLLFDFPIRHTAENPLNLTIKWTDGLQCRLAIVNKLPLLLVEDQDKDGKVHHSEFLSPEVMELYLEDLGLPESMFGSDIQALLHDLHSCSDVFVTQRAYTIVDPFSTLEVVHDARLKQDMYDERQLVQELTINIDHLDQSVPVLGPNEIVLSQHPRFRNMLRFERNADNTSWDYAGAYSGKLATGELIDELEQVDPRLGIPSSKILEKAFNTLNFK